MKTEANLTVGLVTSLIVAAIGLLRAYGVSIDAGQENAIVGFIASFWEVAVVLGGFVAARNFVFSQASVEKLTGLQNPVVPEVVVHEERL